VATRCSNWTLRRATSFGVNIIKIKDFYSKLRHWLNDATYSESVWPCGIWSKDNGCPDGDRFKHREIIRRTMGHLQTMPHSPVFGPNFAMIESATTLAVTMVLKRDAAIVWPTIPGACKRPPPTGLVGRGHCPWHGNDSSPWNPLNLGIYSDYLGT
jgi:hypothetical protein